MNEDHQAAMSPSWTFRKQKSIKCLVCSLLPLILLMMLVTPAISYQVWGQLCLLICLSAATFPNISKVITIDLLKHAQTFIHFHAS